MPELGTLIGEIYAAATDLERWPIVLDAMSDLYRGASIVMGRQSFSAGVTGLLSTRIAPGSIAAYVANFARAEQLEFIRVLPEIDLAKPITSDAFLGERQLLASPVYKQVMEPFGLRYMVTSILHRGRDWALFISLVRSARAGPYSPSELTTLEKLCRHLARAAAIQHALADARMVGAVLADVLDKFDRGAIVTDKCARIMFANRKAHAILDRRDGLVTTNDRLAAWRGRDTTALLKLVAGCAATSAGVGCDAGGALRLPRRSGGRDYAVLVTPLSATMMTGLVETALALVLVTDAERSPTSRERLIELHGFTAAEARLASHLWAGETAAEAACALGVSLTTIRYHLRNIFAKTGARRQAELIALLDDAPIR